VNDHVLDRRYHGGADKACYLYSADHYSFWQNKYLNQEWNWGMFGENQVVFRIQNSVPLLPTSPKLMISFSMTIFPTLFNDANCALFLFQIKI